MTSTKLIIGPGRISFPHLLEAQEGDNGPRFSTAILLPPTTDLAPLRAALDSAWKAKFGEDKAKWPKGDSVNTPDKVIKKADTQYSNDGSLRYPGFDGWFVVNVGCSADYPPEVVDANTDTVTDKRQVYAGRWARVSANAYGYRNKKVGVTFGLNNVQLLKHDKALAGKAPARNDFDVVAEEMSAGAGEGEGNWE
jgi:hypothetical protein